MGKVLRSVCIHAVEKRKGGVDGQVMEQDLSRYCERRPCGDTENIGLFRKTAKSQHKEEQN